MPIKNAAKKALRQSRVKNIINIKVKKTIKDLIKESRKLIEAKNQVQGAAVVKAAVKAIDKAMQKGILKRNNGARKKSRLMKLFGKIGK